MTTERKFYKQKIIVTIISPDNPIEFDSGQDFANILLTDIENDIAYGLHYKSCGKIRASIVPGQVEKMGYSRGYFDGELECAFSKEKVSAL